MANKKYFKKLAFFLLFLSHIGFLISALIENRMGGLTAFAMAISLVLLLVAYLKLPLVSNDESLGNYLNIAFVFIGAVSTYFLQSVFNLSVVLAAALVGLLVSFVPMVKIGRHTFKNIPIAVYCGTFVGMTNIGLGVNFIFITMASLLTGLLLIGTKNAFYGVGGKLGTFAFAGVLMAYYITYFIKLL